MTAGQGPSEDSRPWACSFQGCTKAFKNRKVLRKHLLVHQPRRFHCQERGCGKSFYERAKLKRHNLVHSGVKNFACSFEGCDKRFALKANLQTHLRVHTGLRPYACMHPGCEKRFSQTSGRNSHFKTHVNKRKISAIAGDDTLIDTHAHIHIHTDAKAGVDESPMPAMMGFVGAGVPVPTTPLQLSASVDRLDTTLGGGALWTQEQQRHPRRHLFQPEAVGAPAMPLSMQPQPQPQLQAPEQCFSPTGSPLSVGPDKLRSLMASMQLPQAHMSALAMSPQLQPQPQPQPQLYSQTKTKTNSPLASFPARKSLGLVMDDQALMAALSPQQQAVLHLLNAGLSPTSPVGAAFVSNAHAASVPIAMAMALPLGLPGFTLASVAPSPSQFTSSIAPASASSVHIAKRPRRELPLYSRFL